jgi:hypothetical protein
MSSHFNEAADVRAIWLSAAIYQHLPEEGQTGNKERRDWVLHCQRRADVAPCGSP